MRHLRYSHPRRKIIGSHLVGRSAPVRASLPALAQRRRDRVAVLSMAGQH